MTDRQKETRAYDARTNERVLTEIIEWLKDTERVQNQKEDEKILLILHCEAERLVSEGILLPPPNYNDIMHSRDILNYLRLYVTHPRREMTTDEKS